MLRWLIARLTAPRPVGQPVTVHGIYAGTRAEGVFDPRTRTLTVTSGPMSGHCFTSPSAAACAIVAHLKPAVSPVRTGWNFWVITATGQRLHTLRR